MNTVASVLDAYYRLAADYEDLRAKRSAYQTAQQFYNETVRQEQLGALSQLDVDSAHSQLATADGNRAISQASLQQDEVTLKNMLSRRGVLDPALAEVKVMPLDRIEVPEDTLAPMTDLLKTAMDNRADLAAAKANITTAEISAIGTRNGLLPSAQAFGGASNAGLSGSGTGVNRYFVGGIGNALGQAFRRDFPTERIGVFAQVQVYNHQAQADFGIDQLSLRQTELTTQKDINQVAVDISNDVTALRQARARYRAASENRVLEEQLLDAEQKKYALGASTPYNIVVQQRDLAAAQSTQVAAAAAYINARIALDQALGTTLQANHITIDEARTGVASETSQLPATLPPVER